MTENFPKFPPGNFRKFGGRFWETALQRRVHDQKTGKKFPRKTPKKRKKK